VHNFRKLDVWQKSRELSLVVYRVTEGFPASERFGLVSQMRRAAVSVMSNIAEGSGRRTSKDMRHFLAIARGSATELESQSTLGLDLGYLLEPDAQEIERRVDQIRAMLVGLSRTLQTNDQ
jgi:four helix bundle protein